MLGIYTITTFALEGFSGLHLLKSSEMYRFVRILIHSILYLHTFKSCFLVHWRLFIGQRILYIVIISTRGTTRLRCTGPIDYIVN